MTKYHPVIVDSVCFPANVTCCGELDRPNIKKLRSPSSQKHDSE